MLYNSLFSVLFASIYLSAIYLTPVRVGFNIVWSVLYEHREYNHSRVQTILKLAYITTTHFQAASELAAA